MVERFGRLGGIGHVGHLRVLLVASGSALASLHCTTDHDQLAKRPSTSGGGGGTTGSGGASSTQSANTITGSSVSSTGVPPFEYVPDGDDVLTFVHGQVDAPRIAFCFAPSISDMDETLSGLPEPAGGLAYGGHVSFREPGGLSLSEEIVPIVLAGAEPEDFELSCADAINEATLIVQEAVPPQVGAGGQAGAGAGGAAGGGSVPSPPSLRAMQLPRLTEGSLQIGRHYVTVIAGCMGGTAAMLTSDQCGVHYAAGRATLRPLLMPVSRATSPLGLSLQFMHASAASPEIDLRSSPPSDSPGIGAALATDLTYGAATFAAPEQNWSTSELGVSEGASIEVLEFNQKSVAVSWQAAAELGGAAPLQDGEAYLMVLLGPNASADSDGVNPATVSIIPTGAGRAP